MKTWPVSLYMALSASMIVACSSDDASDNMYSPAGGVWEASFPDGANVTLDEGSGSSPSLYVAEADGDTFTVIVLDNASATTPLADAVPQSTGESSDVANFVSTMVTIDDHEAYRYSFDSLGGDGASETQGVVVRADGVLYHAVTVDDGADAHSAGADFINSFDLDD